MAVYRVTPLNDDVDMRSNWQVKKDGRMKSKHTKKSAAKRKANRLADTEDSVVLHRTDGTVIG